jgi:ribose transport system substrate-binding protein
MKTIALSASALCLAMLIPFQAASAATKVGLLTKDRNLFWTAIEQGANQAAKTAGVELIVRAPAVANNVAQQLRLLASLEKEAPAAILVGPLSQQEFKTPISAFTAKGVKIVAIDTPLPEGCANVYIGYNQKAIASASAALLSKLVNDGDEIGLLGANSIEGLSPRERAIIATIKEQRPKSTLHLDVKAGIEKDDDYSQSLTLLQRHPGIKGVLTPFSSSTIAMMKALKAKGLAGRVTHVGIGTGFPAEVEDAIKSGELQGFIAQQPKLMGAKAVEAAVDLLAGKTVPATIDVDFVVITKDNVNDPKLAALR